MKEQHAGDTLMQLTEAAAIQDDLVQHRLGIERAKTLLDRLLRTWMQLEIQEEMAYEDKVNLRSSW